MTGERENQAEVINPALERVRRVERALNHLSRAIELELADVALSEEGVDEKSAQEYRELGAALLRLSSVGMNTANSLASTLGEPTKELPQDNALVEKIVADNAEYISPVSQNMSEKNSNTHLPKEAVDNTRVAEKSDDTVNEDITPDRQDSIEETESDVKATSHLSPDKKSTVEKPRYEGELYRRIISEKDTPLMELREGMEAIPIRIVTDDTIIVNGEKIVLEGDELFIFNGLMKLRDNVRASKEIRKLGFRLDGPSGSAAFSKAMKDLIGQIDNATGPNHPVIIKKIGEAAGTKYAVNPSVVLEEERIDIDAEENDTENVKKK